MDINNLLQEASSILKEKNIQTYKIDSELILSQAIKKDLSFILANGDFEIDPREIKTYKDLILRRKKNEPIAYILKRKEFWSIDFNLNRNVLIPRPETEFIVEEVIKKYRYRNAINILDIGTGSGCILLSLLKNLENSRGIGIDRSKKAIKIAQKNCSYLKLQTRSKFINCNIDNFRLDQYDIIVSNPPYICSHRVRYLSRDIRDYEPIEALDGGVDGMRTTIRIVKKSQKLLKKGGHLYIEIGEKQFNKLSNILLKNNFRIVKKVYDYRKNLRCIISTKVI